MLLSIIIPVYNVEKYIGGTLSSVYNQSFDESQFEVIVVNDGTSDNSMDVVKEFIQKHSNITVINQKNQGLSCARNAGLNVARGDYIWFVDSDDAVTEDSLKYIENLVNNIKADVYAFDMLKICESDGSEKIEPIILKKKYQKYYNRPLPVERFWKKIHICPAQRFLFLRKFLIDNELSFFPGIYHEDEEFDVRALVSAKSIVLINQSIYRYLVRSSGSIMSSFKMKSAWSKIQIIKNFEKEIAVLANTKKSGVLFDRIFENAFWLLSRDFSIHAEYEGFVVQNKEFLKKNLWSGFWRSLRYVSLGKFLKAVKSFL